MKMSFEHLRLAIAGSLLITGSALVADGTRFSDFTPLATSAGPVPVSGEATPITFGNPDFQQRSIADRVTQLAAGKPNSSAWDMVPIAPPSIWRPARRSARWASNGTPGSEFTGLYFDPTDKRRAWVNIQHPASGNDRTIEIRIP